jgi:small subunit ribosomal protein S8
MTKSVLNEIITRIRNALISKSPGVEIPKTQMTRNLAKILLKEGFIEEISEPIPDFKLIRGKLQSPFLFIRLKYHGVQRISVITGLKLVSRSSLRVYIGRKGTPKVIGGLGLLVFSTSQGLITDREARRQNLGGEFLFSVWLFFYSYEGSLFGKKNMRKVSCNPSLWKSSCNL